MVRMMQNAFDIIKHHMKTGAVTGLNCCTQMMKQRFNFSPVDVTADRIDPGIWHVVDLNADS